MKLLLLLLALLLAKPALAEDLSLCIDGWQKSEAGDHAGAIPLLQKCVEEGNLSEKNLARTYRNIGIVHKRNSQYQESLQQMNLALSHKPEDPWNDYVNRGTVWVLLGELDRALRDYNQALSLNPDYGPAYYGRGEIFDLQGEPQKALEEYHKAFDSGWRTSLLYEKFRQHGIIGQSETSQ